MKQIGGLFLFVAALLAVRPASASERAAAEALFDAGVAAAEAEDFETACEKFEASNRLDPAPGTILNIADCKEQLGLIASAWQRYREAAARFDPEDERAAYAQERADVLEPRLPRVTLQLDKTAGDVSLSRNGEPLPDSVAGVPLPVNPGTHEYRLEVRGHEPSVQELSIAEGETKTLTLAPGPPLAEPPVVEPAEQKPMVQTATPPQADMGTRTSGSGQRIWGWTGVGTGVAGLVLGSVTGFMTIDRANEVEECRDDFCPTERGVDAAREGRTLSTVSTVAFVAGAAVATTGVVLLVTAPRSPETSRAKSQQIRVGLVPRAGGALLSLGGTL